MNCLRLCIRRNTFYSIYVDNVHIVFQSCSLAIYERQVQLGISKVSKRAEDKGLRFNPQKSICVLFSRKRGLHLYLRIAMLCKCVSASTEHKFLGGIFDGKLSFVLHIKSTLKTNA